MGNIALFLENFRVKRGKFKVFVKSLKIEEKKLVAICGGNGSGKSTFLLALAGILPFEGKCKIFGTPLKKDQTFYKKISYLPQETSLSLPYDVFYVVLTGRYPLVKGGKYRKEDFTATERILKKLGLISFKHREFGTLSGGEKRRVLIARAFNREASFLLLDEPFSELDLFYQFEVLKFLRNYVDERNALALVVIHDYQLALRFFDEVIFFKNGEVVLKSPGYRVSQEFLTDFTGVKIRLISACPARDTLFFVR